MTDVGGKIMISIRLRSERKRKSSKMNSLYKNEIITVIKRVNEDTN